MNKTMKIAIVIGIILLLLTGVVVGGYFYFNRDGEVAEIPSPLPTAPVVTLEPPTTVEPSPESSFELPPTEQTLIAVNGVIEGTSFEVSPTVEIGMIDSEVLLNGIEVSLILTEPFVDVLGEPMDVQGHWIYYEGLRLFATGDELDMAFLISIENISMLEIDGLALGTNIVRSKILSVFGDPIEYYEYPDWIFIANQPFAVRYHVLGDNLTYTLEIWFESESESDDPPIINVTIRRYGN